METHHSSVQTNLKSSYKILNYLYRFKHAWAEIDTNGTGYIQKEDVANLLHKFTGRFQFRIYDETQSVSNIIKHIKLDTQKRPSCSVIQSRKTPPGKRSDYASPPENYDVNLHEINKCLGKMDREEVRRRRLEYNLYFKVSA